MEKEEEAEGWLKEKPEEEAFPDERLEEEDEEGIEEGEGEGLEGCAEGEEVEDGGAEESWRW